MTQTTAPSDRQEKLMIRMPPGLRQRVKIEAAKAHRSMSGEVVFRLEKSFEAEGATDAS